MKAIHTKEFWERNKDRFITGKTINPEKDLQRLLRYLDTLQLPEEELKKVKGIVTKAEAQKVYDTHRKELLERMKLVEKANKNPNCLGYTTKIQEVNALRELTLGFELDCFILSEFKDKHLN